METHNLPEKNVSGKGLPKVLVVDDEPETTFSVIQFLKSKGFEAIESNDPEDAIAKFTKDTFDAVILDLSMPLPKLDNYDQEKLEYGRLTGLAIAEKIREHSPNTPVIILSVVMQKWIKDKIDRCSVKYYFNKPIDPNSLLEKLTQVITEKGKNHDNS